MMTSTVPAAATATASRLILVHGAGHGGWCWYRVATMLRAAGHRVHAPDLAASGADARRLRDAPTFADYSRPLLDAVRALPGGERAVLVGHSLGGMSVALAAEELPERVAAAVFVAAFMPDCASPRPSVIDKVCKELLARCHARADAILVVLSGEIKASMAGLDGQREGRGARSAVGEARAGADAAEVLPAEPGGGLHAGAEPGPDGLQLRGRHAPPAAVQRGPLRRGAQGVRGVRGGPGHRGGLPAADDRRLPGGGGEGDRRRRPHGHVLRASGARRTPCRRRQHLRLIFGFCFLFWLPCFLALN
ncbi:Os01g0355800 [Oryza sativa Japonica Group]|uniref:Os01g0355800 protein n=1 Tax=Oryza sativa subsp. japonica TaxID=39947 RepID=A0A0N7KCX9_ORYSJ|nr:hypothetical protein EE612_002516 [Oryza sativa]BAS72065.1 Os01g0355800 [Oryza sativa Japonica Group]